MSSTVDRSGWKRRRVGERLGRYVLGTCLGAGGAAGVYLARLDGPRGFERVLALKIVHEHLLEDRDFTAMFLDEANLAVRLSHPNVVHTYELAHQGALLFTAMEYLPGKPLSRVYQRAFERQHPLAYDLVAWIGARAADALNYAHELADDSERRLSVVHRDVSPDNLVVTYDGQVKVIDFGIARAEGRIARTDLGKVKGKFRYMAPEYALGQQFDHTLDLFALGATLYETALGLAAFEAEDDSRTLERLMVGDIVEPSSLRSDFPPALARIIRRAIDPDASRRYRSGAEMAADLDAFAGLDSREAVQRLGGCMRELFEREIELENGWVRELRALKPPTLEEVTPTQHQITVTPPRKDVFAWVWPAGALAALSLAAGVAVLRPYGPRAAASANISAPAIVRSDAREEPQTDVVVIDVSVQPASAAAVIHVGDDLVSDRPARKRMKRSGTPVSVLVRAEGFEPAALEVVPDRDQFLVVPLVSARPSPVVAPAGRQVSGRTPARHARAPSQVSGPNAEPASTGVIRENPFSSRESSERP